MISLKTFPEAVENVFKEKGVDTDALILTMKTDIGSDGVMKDVFIAVDTEHFYALEGCCVLSRPKGHIVNVNAEHILSFDVFSYTVLELSSLSDPVVESLITNGSVTAMSNGESLLLFNFSNTYKHDAGVFCRVINDLKKDGKIDSKKYKEDDEKEVCCPKCKNRYPDPKRKICPKCMDKKKLIKQLAVFFIRYKGYMALIFLTFVLVTALGVITPYVSNKVFYDEVLSNGGKYYGKIVLMILLIIAVRFLSLIINVVNGIISAKVAARVVYDLKKTIFNTIGTLSLSFFTSRQTGGLMTQVNSDATTIYWFFCDGFPYFVTNIIQLIVILALMLAINPILTLYTFITVPIFFITYKLIFLLFSKLHARAYSKRRSFNSLISDVLNGMRVVKSFSRENDEIKRFDKSNVDSSDADKEISVTGWKIFPFLNFLLKIGSFTVWGIGGWQIMNHSGGMTYGLLMTFIAFINMIYSPLQFLADTSNWWSECLNALQRLFEISDTVPEVRQDDNPITPKDIKGEVEFKNVSFSYVENRNVLENISFNVPAGSTLGIVGHTGAGKSTLANIITRLYDPGSGEVYIDGIDLKKLSFESLRSMIAIVSQETYLFKGTILENIKYARPDATDEEVIIAAKIASAHQFIIKYPDGYETTVGFGGKELSGGERQRISIARAVLKEPQILILDEATAAMDTQTERQIQEALDRLTENRTTIIIAHRLSTLRDADKLIVIEKGKIVESGTFNELLAQKGVYFKLYKLQAEALKNVGIEA